MKLSDIPNNSITLEVLFTGIKTVQCRFHLSGANL